MSQAVKNPACSRAEGNNAWSNSAGMNEYGSSKRVSHIPWAFYAPLACMGNRGFMMLCKSGNSESAKIKGRRDTGDR